MAERRAGEPAACADVQGRERDAEVLDREPPRPWQDEVRRHAERAPDPEPQERRKAAERAARTMNRPGEQRIARAPRRATKPVPERAPGHSHDAGAQQVVQVDHARGPPGAVGEDEQRGDRVPLHERHRLGRERPAGDRLG